MTSAVNDEASSILCAAGCTHKNIIKQQHKGQLVVMFASSLPIDEGPNFLW